MCDNNDEINFDTFTKYKCKKYDPLEEINIDKKKYDSQFLDLLNHIFKLSANQSIKIKENIDKPEILLNHPAILLDYIKQLILYINDLLKIFIKLYNLEMGISYLVKNTDFNFIKESKDIIEDYFIKQNISEKDKEFFYKNIPVEEKFIPLEYTPYDLSILNEIKTEQDLLDVSNFFLEDFIKLENAIKDLIKLSEKFTFILDLKTVTKLILTQIIPKEYNIENNEGIQIGGADVTVQTVYNKLNLLKNLLEGIGSDILGKEIPYSVNLEINDAMKIIKLFQTNLEKNASTKDASGNIIQGTKINYDFNLFQSIPEYMGIPKITGKFIQNPIEGQLPGTDLELPKIENIISTITNKTTEFANKLANIDKLNKELYDLNTKIEKYKIDEIAKQINSTIIYEYTDKGTKAEIIRDISDIETELTQKNTDKVRLDSEKINLETKKNDLLIFDDTSKMGKLKDYIIKLKTAGSQTSQQLLDELKTYISTLKNGRISYNLSDYDEIYKKIESVDNFFTNLTLDKIGDLEKFRKKISEMTIIQKNNIPLSANSTKLFQTLSNNDSQLNKKIKEKIIKIKELNEINTIDPAIKDLYENNIKSNIPNILTSNIALDTQLNDYKTTEMTNIDSQINSKQGDIQNIDRETQTLIQKKEDLKSTLQTLPNDDINILDLIELKDTEFNQIIMLLQDKIKNINEKMKSLFSMKENKDTNPYGEENISVNVGDFNPNWYNKDTIIGGGDQDAEIEFTKYKDNLIKINKVNEMNTEIRKLLIKIELYKSKTTELFELYTNTMKNLNSILVYLYYKLTVFRDYYNNIKEISGKFDITALNQLKNNISSKTRKNFDFIKEIYIKVIDVITSNMNNSDKKYVKYSKTSGLLNLLVLTHLKTILNLII